MELCSLEQCNSCMACYNACPFDAIEIVPNDCGAIQPKINHEKCKECALCQKTCPQLNAPSLHSSLHCYALYAKSDYDRQTCASGGAATTFSRSVISQGGCVFGATASGGYPHYIKVTNESELELLKGSKYVYCDPEKIYSDVKEELVSGRLCLFIGTPCNVAGLLGFLKKEYDNLYTIDLICHGTPPFSYLKEHVINKIGDYSQVGNFTFRGKYDFYLTVYDKNNEVIYKRDQYEDEYFMSFMRGFMFRPVCYNCQFAQKSRVSDITIGDFWNISDDALSGYKGKISVALINSEKGDELFNSCIDSFVYEEREVQEAINGNDQLRHPSPVKTERDVFVFQYEKTKSVEKCFKVIGISQQSLKNRIRRYVLYVPRIIKRLIIR